VADADEKVAWTGPVLRSCSVNGNELSLTFDDELLGDDTIMVLQSTSNTFGWDLDGTVSLTRRLNFSMSLSAAASWPGCNPGNPTRHCLSSGQLADGACVVVALQPGDKFSPGSADPNLELMMIAMALGPESPLEIQINGTNMTDGAPHPILSALILLLGPEMAMHPFDSLF